MTHNDVARRSARELPARSLTPRPLACDTETSDRPAPRALARPLPARSLYRSTEGGQ